MEAIFRDIRYGIRSLAKSPALTIFATLALTLGIGLTTTMFSIVYGVMLKGLSIPDGARVVEVSRQHSTRMQRNMGMSVVEYADYRDQQKSFDRMAAFENGTMNVSGTGAPERYQGAWVTASFFEVMRTKPLLGRVLLPGEDAPQGQRVAVIGYALWKNRYGGDSSVLGQVLRVNAQPFTIVGVMPEGFRLPIVEDLWIPLQDDPLLAKRDEGREVTVIALLKPGVKVDQASVEMAAIAKGLATRFKETNEGVSAHVQHYVDAELGPEAAQLLYPMLGAVFFVLLIACANVATLLLARAAHRTKEIGIRSALGASRAAVVRQFLIEALVLATGGALFGTAVAYGGISVFNRYLADAEVPSFIDIRLHPPVLMFVVAIAALAALFSGAIPAIQSSRADINEVLKDESRGSSSLHMGRMSRALVVFEIALSCGLLVASGLMIKSVTTLKNMDPGFRTANIFTARIGFPATYTDTLMQARFYDQLRERLGGLPGVQSVAITSSLPGVGDNGGSMQVEGVTYATDNEVPNGRWLAVSPGFFGTFEIKASRGRVLDASDRAGGNPVIVVNQAFADKYFPGADPLGRRIRQGGLTTKLPWMTVVGVVPTAYSGDTQEPRAAAYYAPLPQHHQPFISMAVRTAGAPMSLTKPVRDAVTQLDPDVPIYRVYSMDQALARPTWFIRVFGTMFMIFGAIALFLASMGLYAVMSFSVSRRTREVGIRMALGAQAGQVVRLIFRQGAWQLGLGLVVGLVLAAFLARFTSIILFQVNPRDPVIFGGVVVVLTVVGIVACLIPARRATRVDPLTALRAE